MRDAEQMVGRAVEKRERESRDAKVDRQAVAAQDGRLHLKPMQEVNASIVRETDADEMRESRMGRQDRMKRDERKDEMYKRWEVGWLKRQQVREGSPEMEEERLRELEVLMLLFLKEERAAEMVGD